MAFEVHWLRFKDLTLYWPSHNEARYQTKKVINYKHLILLKKLKVFRTAITLQDTAFGIVCQVHPLSLRGLPQRLLIVGTNTLAYTVHCLRFQDFSLYCLKNWWFLERLSLSKHSSVFDTVFRTVDFPYLASSHRKVPFLLMQQTYLNI